MMTSTSELEPTPTIPAAEPPASFAHIMYLFGSGATMGAADIVPGVSGGTMAIATGVYESLLAALSSINVRSVKALLTLKWREAFSILHWRFLITLGLGIAAAISFMVWVVKLPHLVETYPTYVYAVFFGLVLASAGVLSRRASWRATTLVSLVVGVAAGWLVVNLTPVETPEGPAFIFLCGLIAICAMLLPGISGSFILLIMGKYTFIVGAVHDRDIGALLPFAAGCIVGILAFSRVVKWLLARWHDVVLAGLIGLLLGPSGASGRIKTYESRSSVRRRRSSRRRPSGPRSSAAPWPCSSSPGCSPS